jgi:hypothetical protein
VRIREEEKIGWAMTAACVINVCFDTYQHGALSTSSPLAALTMSGSEDCKEMEVN